MSDENTKVNPQLANAIQSGEFYRDYANNVFLESSEWDMKLIFGQLDQRTIPFRVEQHGSVSLPWNQAKVFAYLLCVHLAAYELQNGKITVPNSVLPPEPTPPKEGDPNLQALFQRMIWLREQFFGEMAKP